MGNEYYEDIRAAQRALDAVYKLEHFCYWSDISTKDEPFYNGIAYAVGIVLAAIEGKKV